VGPVARVALKNQIDRQTSTTPQEGGGLYEFDEVFNGQISIYARISQGADDIVQGLFDYLADSGYGKRKSVGYGQIESSPSLEPFEGFGSPNDPNGFVSLSTFVPAQRDPSDGYWNLLVKYGKVGEELAYSDNPFKFPMLMLRAGAVFYDSPVREFYGRVVEGVSPHFDFVMQPSYCLPVPMRLPEGLAYAAVSEAKNPNRE
jgi:CRISPR-associated protein Csm4